MKYLTNAFKNTVSRNPDAAEYVFKIFNYMTTADAFYVGTFDWGRISKNTTKWFKKRMNGEEEVYTIIKIKH